MTTILQRGRCVMVGLLMLGILAACGQGDGTGADMNGEVQGVPGTVSPSEMQTTTTTP